MPDQSALNKQNNSQANLDKVTAQALELRREGDRFFATKEYLKAIENYDTALNLLPQKHQDSVQLFSNKAACYLFMQSYNDAIIECNRALEVNSNAFKALQRRAVAYDNLKNYNSALKDIHNLQKLGQDNDENRKTEQRLQALIEGKHTPQTNGKVDQPTDLKYTQQTSQSQSQSQLQNQRHSITHFMAKVNYDEGKEIKIIEFPLKSTYADVLQEVQTKFPTQPPYLLKYQNQQNNRVLIKSRWEIERAVEEAMTTFKKQYSAIRMARMPKIVLFLEKVDDEKEVPSIPMMELKERERANLAKQIQPTQQQKDDGEDWVVDFAYLFREQLKLDVDRRMDLQQVGWEKCQLALDEAQNIAKPGELFNQSIEKFRELTAVGLFNWGVAHNYQVQRRMEDMINKGGQALVLQNGKQLLEDLKVCDSKFEDALSYKFNHFDTFLAQAQLYATKAKIDLGFYLPLNNKDDQEKNENDQDNRATENGHVQSDKADNQELTEQEKQAKDDRTRAIQKKKIVGLIENINKDGLQMAQELFERAHKKFQETFTLAQQQKKDNTDQIQEQQQQLSKGEAEDIIKSEQLQQQLDEIEAPITNVLMSWGNILFEESLIYAGLGQDWETPLFEAIEKFREGGAKEDDILAAMKIHMKQEEIKLPPVPEHIKVKQAEIERKQQEQLKSLEEMERKRNEETNMEDSKVEDTKVEDTKVEDTKVEDTKTEDSKADDVKGLPSLKSRKKEKANVQ